MTRDPIPFRVTSDEHGVPVVLLDGRHLEQHLTRKGLAIKYVDVGHVSVPQVTLTFGPGSLVLDFDVDLLGRLLGNAQTTTTEEETTDA